MRSHPRPHATGPYREGCARVRATRSLVPRPPQARPRRLDRRARARQRRRRRGRRRVPRRVQPARRRVARPGFDILDDQFGGQGTGTVGTIVFRAEQGVDDPEVRAADGGAVRPRSPRHRRRDPGREPLRRRRRAADRVRGRPRPGKIAYANVELPEDIDFTRAARDPRRDPGRRRPRSTGVRVELGGFIFAEFEQPSSELLGLGVRHRHPDRRVRLGARDGPAGRRRRCSASASAAPSSRCSATSCTIPDFATVPRRHDRPRRRHRLRAAHRHPLPRAAPRRPRPCASRSRSPSTPPGARSLFAGTTVVISLLGMLLMGVALRQRPRHRRRVGGRGHRGRVAHAAARAARLRRRHGSSCTRWRGLIAAGFVAVAPRRRRPRDHRRSMRRPPARGRSCSSPASSSRRSSARSRTGRRSPAARPSAYRWSRVIQHRPWTAAIVGAAVLLVLAIPVLAPAPRLLRREQLRRRHHHQAGLRPAGRRVRRRASTARSSSSPRCPTAPTLGDARRRDRGRRAPTPAWRSCRRPAPNDPDEPDRGALERRARPPARRTRRPPSSSTACATTCCRRSRTAAGVEVLVTGVVAVNVDFSDYLAERAAVLLRRRARRCRSCC